MGTLHLVEGFGYFVLKIYMQDVFVGYPLTVKLFGFRNLKKELMEIEVRLEVC